jgi:hypothetical protein
MKRSMNCVLSAMVCISILIHGFFFFILNKSTKEKPVPTKNFQLEWHSLSQNIKKERGKSSTNKQKSRNGQSLQRTLRTNWSTLAKNHQLVEGLSKELTDVDIAAYGLQVSIEKTLRDDLELPMLWKQIRAFLRYRPEHALARIAGDVQLRIRVDRDGKLLRIFEEGASGRKELLGWTILCLLEAFREPFLTKPLKDSRTLDLRIQYTMGEQVLSSNSRSARMLFVVEGDLYTGSDPQEQNPPMKGHLEPQDHPNRIPFEVKLYNISTKQIANIFRDKTLKNHLEWSYYAQRDFYQEHCYRHLNPLACERLNEIKNKVEP